VRGRVRPGTARYKSAARLRETEDLGRPLYGEGFAVELDHELRIARRTLNGVTLLACAAETCQVIVLTSDPARYSAVPGARVVTVG